MHKPNTQFTYCSTVSCCTYVLPLLPQGPSSGADDRILQCCLDFKQRLASKEVAQQSEMLEGGRSGGASGGKRYSLALLSNDNMLCLKVRLG